MVLICVAFFFGHLSKVPSVLIGLKTPVLGGGILYPPTKFFDLKEGGVLLKRDFLKAKIRFQIVKPLFNFPQTGEVIITEGFLLCDPVYKKKTRKYDSVAKRKHFLYKQIQIECF